MSYRAYAWTQAMKPSSKRKTYKVEVTVSIQVDDERLAGVERIVQEHVNVLYHRMERDDIRVVLQHQCKVTEVL